VDANLNYEQAVARERENRLLAYLPVSRPLFGRLLSTLRWRHVLELSLAQNAFFGPRCPEPTDVFDFLWALDLHFTRPDGSMPNWPSGAKRPGRFARWRARCDCYRISRSAAPTRLEPSIRAWIEEKWQDMPAAPKQSAAATSIFAPSLQWLDVIVEYYTDRGHSFESVLEMPVALTMQMLRARTIAAGHWERCLDPSSAILKQMV
jgi:hypothetical protein